MTTAAKLKTLDDDYESKLKPLDDEYWAKREALSGVHPDKNRD